MHIVQVNYPYAENVVDPVALLDRFATLTGWSEALLDHAGREHRDGLRTRVSVVQRFSADASIQRHGVDYFFRRERGGGTPPRWSRCTNVARTVCRLDPDLVHVNGVGFLLPTWWLRTDLARATAVVVQDHASLAPRVGRVRSWLRRRAMAGVDAWLFCARDQAAPWLVDGSIGARQSIHEVLESSTSLSRLPRAAARRTSGIEGRPSVLWVGRLNENKDPLTVLNGFERALAEIPEAILTMVYGEDDLLPAVCERVNRSAKLRGRVRLAGRVAPALMPAFYSAADLFVVGSHHEGSGYALLEASACGCVPVVTDIASFRAITGNGSVGRLWTPGDASSCARALAAAGLDDIAAQSSAVMEHFDRSLSWTALGRRAWEIYRTVLAARTTRTAW